MAKKNQEIQSSWNKENIFMKRYITLMIAGSLIAVLTVFILISSLAGTLVGIILMVKARSDQREMAAIPFGPYLAAGGWITLIWGKNLANWYLSIIA